MDIKADLNLLFDSGDVLALLQKLCDIFSKNLDISYDKDDTQYSKDMEPYFEKTKMFLEFFSDEDVMNSFGENNTNLIKKIL